MPIPTDTTMLDEMLTQQPPIIDPQQQEQAKRDDQIRSELFEFSKAKTRIDKRIQDWGKFQQLAISNRRTRDIDLSITDMRQKGQLKPDETLLPQRLVDTNIKREMPAYLKYITGSRRLVTFSCPTNPHLDCQEMESEFKRGMSYSKWEIPHIKTIDGSQTHGVDFAEVVFDETKPLHCAIEHIGYENLIFNESILDIQQDEFILRVYEWTPMYLRSCVKKYGFDPKEIEEVIERQSKTTDNKVCTIYKRMFKFEGIVYVDWYAKDCSKFLLTTAPLKIGISEQVSELVKQPQTILDPVTKQPVTVMLDVPQITWQESQIGMYPVFPMIYNESEARALLSHHGRVYYDKYKQEAQTAIATGYVNKMTRSQNVYASSRTPDVSGGSMKQLEMELEDRGIYNQPLDYWGPPEPNPNALMALKHFAGSNAEEVGSVTMQAQMKTDRQPATAYNQAAEKEAELDSVQLINLSTYIREIYSFAWLIVQSQALQGKVTFLPDDNGQNQVDLIGLKYEVRAAGDVDVIERKQKLQMMMQFWPIVANIPALAQVFLKNMLKLAFPEDGNQYSSILDSVPSDKQLIEQLWAMVQAMSTPEEISQLQPQQKVQLEQLSQMVKQSLGIQDQQAANGKSPAQQSQPNPQVAQAV